MNIQTKSFTGSYNEIKRVLRSPAKVARAHDPSSYQHIVYKQYIGIWDTGDTGTVISSKVIQECGLKTTGMAKVEHIGGKHKTNTYLINIILRNNVQIVNLPVIEGKVTGGANILIGMDVITMGDFAVTNKGGKTVFSFQMPSVQCIDFTKQNKEPKTTVRSPTKIGRNDPCPCGSRKKYKNCCLNK